MLYLWAILDAPFLILNSPFFIHLTMSYWRTTISNTFIEALTQKNSDDSYRTAASDRVFNDALSTVTDDENNYPYILVKIIEADAHRLAASYEYVAKVQLLAVVTGLTELQLKLDNLCQQIERILITDPKLVAIIDARHINITFTTQVNAQIPVAIATFSFQVQTTGEYEAFPPEDMGNLEKIHLDAKNVESLVHLEQ